MASVESGQSARERLLRWQETPLGAALLAAEARQVRRSLEDVFGDHLLQLGRWGTPTEYAAFARTRLATTVFDCDSGDVRAELSRLPFESNAVDAVLLPHTLDLADRPHDCLREAHRVLRAEGRMIIVGFKPFGLWGLRRLLSGRRFPPAVNQVLAERSLKDWLQLLDMRIMDHQRFFFRPPFDRLGRTGTGRDSEFSERWWPELGACYLLQARKRAVAMTPLKTDWRKRARVVGGVPEPSLRNPTRLG